MKTFAPIPRALLIYFRSLLVCTASAFGQLVPVLPSTAPSTRPTTAATTRPAPPAGDYLGTLQAGAIPLRLGLKIERKGDGSFTGLLDSIDQGAKVPIDRVEFDQGQLKLALKVIDGSYEGTIKNDGESISGKWKQGGMTLPLTFKRVAEAVTLKRPQEPKRPFPYREEKVTVQNPAAADVKLAGTLTPPKSAGPFPAVLLITGSGPQDRDEMVMGHRPFLILADHLTRQGMAVLRLDDRGVGESTGDFAKATTDEFVSDAQAALAFLRARKEIDPKRIGLLGHSEGGVTGPLVATKDPAVAFLVLIAAPGVPLDQLLVRQSRDMGKLMGASDARLAAAEPFNRELFAILKSPVDNTEAERQVRACLDRHMATLSPAERAAIKAAGDMPEMQMLLTPWFRKLLRYDPAPTLAKVKCPVLAVWGEKDAQVAAKENLAAVAAALRGNHDVTTAELPGLNHLLQTCKTGSVMEYSTIEETMSPAALKQIGEWVRERARSAPPTPLPPGEGRGEGALGITNRSRYPHAPSS